MTKLFIETKIIEILATTLQIDRDRIKGESSLKDMGADSLDLYEIMLSIENEFGIAFPQESTHWSEFNKVDRLIDYVVKETIQPEEAERR